MADRGGVPITYDKFLERAFQAHGDRYRYDKESYTAIKSKTVIFCNIHGRFEQVAYDHIAGHGCRYCKANAAGDRSRLSVAEILERFELKHGKSVPERYRQHTLNVDGKTYIFDAYDPTTNVVYEFWGDFYHGNPMVFPPEGINKIAGKTYGELFDRTQERRRFITSYGFNLIEIWEHDYDLLKRLPHSD